MLKRIDSKSSLAVIIGVGKYDNLVYPSVEIESLFENAVRNSVERVAGLFVEELGFPSAHVKLLLDPTVEEALKLIGSCAADDLDAMVFYFCGHGVLSRGELYLGFRELDVKAVQIGGCLMSEILALLSQIKAKTKFIVLDCCFGGGGLEDLPMNFSPAELRSEINLLGSFSIASAGKNVQALVPEGANNTAFTGTVCDVVEEGIELAGQLMSIDEFFREVRRRMIEASYPVPIRVSSIDDDLIALAPNRRFIPESQQLRFQINVMSERLQLYGRYFRQSNDANRDAIQQLKAQDARFGKLASDLDKKIVDEVRALDQKKADWEVIVRRIGWVYIAIVFACALSIVASVSLFASVELITK